MDYADLLRRTRLPDAALHSACRTGSRVYGTASPTSDEDFYVVLADEEARDDLLFRGGANFVLKGKRRYREALAEQSVLALEALFAPAAHRLKEGRPPVPWSLDRGKLATSANARSEADWAKAAKTFVEEPAAAKKKLFHALRVPMFARQVAARGRLVDFEEAAPLWAEIRGREGHAWEIWEAWDAAYGPLRARICAEIAPRKGKVSRP